MGWFHSTLKDMGKAIDKDDWDEVKKILQQHNHCLDKETPKIKSDISDITEEIRNYTIELHIIAEFYKNNPDNRNKCKDEIKTHVKKAISSAYLIDKTLLHLLHEGKIFE